jgi:hypothetical protein
MSDQVPPPPPEPAQWSYTVAGQTQGPLTTSQLREMFASRKLSPQVPVWREGTAQWVLARTIPELVAGLKLRPRELMSPEEHKAYMIVKNAKVNAIAMFVIFVGGVGEIVAATNAALGHKRFEGDCWGTAVVLGGLFAVVYLPMRWRTLAKLPTAFAVLGFIGGIGLLVLLALFGATIAAGLASGHRFR